MKSKQPEMSIEERFANTCQSFQGAINDLAKHCGKTPIKVYKLWRKYSSQCEFSDQSALMREFVDWYSPDLGGDKSALREIVMKNGL